MPALTVPADSPPTRLDVFLTHAVPRCSRRIAQRAIAAGAVRVNGRRARKAASVGAGDVVEVDDALFHPPTLQPNPRLDVPVLYEDAAVVVLDKPAGMPSHALRPDESDTIANFLLARYPETAHVGKTGLEPGIVHRLDTETSGVLLVARTPEAYAALRQQFAAQQVHKEYRAIVHGDVSTAGELHMPLTHDRHNRRKMRVGSDATPAARPAATLYRPVERRRDCTLLAVQIRTGVMHQIRVHLAAIGHPVVGDRLYGAPEVPGAPRRHLLHASEIGFAHPTSGQSMRVSSPLPAAFGDFLAR